MAMPGKKFADVVVARFTKRPPAAAADSSDAGGAAPAPGADDDDGDEDAAPGSQGKMALAASRKGDPEAFEEAIKTIVEDCMKEHGVGQ